MKITDVVLDGFRGFRLRQINHFEYHPRQKTQVILGTNGSGKSSLIKELSPLPAMLQGDYAKGGKKDITIEHMGKTYVLRSLSTPEGPKYEFILDGENLNPGHTVTVYKQLVKEHFNYTAETHAMATGKIRFSRMEVSARRKWLTQINTEDYGYAIRYYQRAKERVTYLQNGLKMTQTRLVQETEKCLTEKGEYELRVKIAELTSILNELLESRKPRLLNPNAIREAIEKHDQDIENNLTRLERLFLTEAGKGIWESKEALQSASMEAQVAINTHRREIEERCARLERLNKDYDAVSRSGSENITDVKRDIAELLDEANDILVRLQFKTLFEDPSAALSSFENTRSSLEAIFTQLRDGPGVDYTRETYESYQRAMPTIEQDLLKAKAEESRCFTERKLHEASLDKGDVVCPKCTHKWVPNYTEAHHKKIIREHEAAVALVTNIEAAKAKNAAVLEDHRVFFECLSQYRGLVRHFPVLQPYWDYISADRKLTTSPDSLLSGMNRFADDLRFQVRYNGIKVILKEKEALLKLMEDAKDLDKTKLVKEIDFENAAILKAQSKAREAFNESEAYRTKLNTLKSVEEYHSNVNDAVAQRDTAIKSLIEDLCVSTLDEIIRSVRLTLSQYERSVSQIDIQKGVVEGLRKQAIEIEAELKLAKLVMKSLSPAEGLIAKGMTGFINHFIKMVNRFIETIWLYPLVILPVVCTEDDGVDLDYRFSVLVNDDLPVKDVSLCSSGMQEVIDLAFNIVGMVCQGMTNFPVYLDEFAATMDPAHRQSAYQAIDNLIESTDYSQVFLVSHYQDGYSSLSAAEVLVLCDSNVQMPAHLVYNQHAVLK